jgi:uncharacterized membrane protein
MTEPQTGSGFDLNKPTIVGLLYVASYLTGITAIIGLVLAYVWRGEPGEGWEDSHYTYLANTFWIGLVGLIVGTILLIVLIGFLVWIATGILCLVRIVMSLVNAQKRQAMPNPGTFLV